MSTNNLEHHKSIYLKILITLFALTVVTVLASYIDWDLGDRVIGGIFVGLFIAAIKGFLVAGNFMHLLDEVKPIYWLLILTTIFFIVLFFMPLLWEMNLVTSK